MRFYIAYWLGWLHDKFMEHCVCSLVGHSWYTLTLPGGSAQSQFCHRCDRYS